MTLTECIAKRGWESDKEITDILDRMQLRIRRRIPDGVFRLTKLQQTAIDTPGFWRDWNSDEPQNLMIQGATSAGKTLLAELAVIDTLAHERRKAIILVPLKSMVHERKKQFSDDMPHPFNVYAASSDYMENDERLLHGDYDVAVIVYEKFFAMLSQENQRIMQNCGLLVVDELAMLSKDQRGPKLELALEMVRRNHSNTRIMCLATSDCSSEKVCRWLNIDDEHHIFSAARPVALEEHLLLLNGQGRYRTIPADCEELSADSNPELQEEHLTIPGYQSDWKVDEKKKQLLQVVLQKLYDRKADFRVLIFVSSQTEASSIASYLRNSISTLFPPISPQNQSPEYESFLRNLGNCEEDEGQLNLIQNLIPHGIAYHHAGLSVTLRELIEEQFQQQASFLKVIVATETLTIGVNMPFDAMIMLSNRVPRGEGAPIRLTQQEYRNYIGRAGRLGQCNSTGITYVFLEEQQDMSYYWKSFNNREEIESALVSAEESYLAPYYLSLLKDNGDDRFTLGQIQALFQDSLTHVCNEKRVIKAQRLYSVLYNAYLADKAQGGAKGRGRGRGAEEEYSIDDFGTLMAPYAFSAQTCIDIFEKFYDGINHNGLPQTTTSEDIESDRYLLDILYHVCRHTEIEQSSVLSYPKSNNNPSRRSEAKKRLIAQLRRILEHKDENGNPCYELWEESENNDLYQLMNSINLRNESRIAEAAMRAVLLFYWTQGKSVREIRKITEFSSFTKVTSGDIERIAEIASFHLDAIYKCIASAWYEVDGLVNSFYILQSRVKYGMTWGLVRLANKHVHGLDRNRLLRLEIAARERGMEPVNYLYFASRTELEHYITRTQLNSLMEALERRSEVTKFDNLIELVAKDAGSTLTDHQKTAIRQVYAFDGPSAQSLYESIRDTVNNNDLLPNIRISTDGSSNRLLWWSGRYGDMMIGVLTDIQDQNQLNSLNTFFRNARERGVPCLLLMVRERNAEQPNEGSCEAWKAQMQKASLQLECPTVFDNQFFAMILANAILKGIVKEDSLTAFLSDARGVYSIDEYKYFSVENYTGDVPAMDKVDLLLICDRNRLAYTKRLVNLSELQTQIGKHLSYGVLPWGQSLEQMDDSIFDVPIVLMLEREMITRSRSLHSFINRLHQNQFHNNLLLLATEDAQQKWNTPSRKEAHGAAECSWNHNFCSIDQIVVHDVYSASKAILDYRTTWKPGHFTIGVSYAHEDSYDESIRENYHSDISLLTQVVKQLSSIYGEHQILFDQFKKANQMFDANQARKKSLDGYRTCKVFLILWNTLTIQRENCKKEREVIQERCKNDQARTIYLRPAHAPKAPESDFALELNENTIQTIVNEVERILCK